MRKKYELCVSGFKASEESRHLPHGRNPTQQKPEIWEVGTEDTRPRSQPGRWTRANTFQPVHTQGLKIILRCSLTSAYLLSKCLITTGQPEENVSKRLSQMRGTRFTEREITGVFFWKTEGKEVKGIIQQVQTWRGHPSRTCWMA